MVEILHTGGSKIDVPLPRMRKNRAIIGVNVFTAMFGELSKTQLDSCFELWFLFSNFYTFVVYKRLLLINFSMKRGENRLL